MARPRGIIVAMADVAPEVEEEYNRFLDQDHQPQRLSVPGFLRARRFVAIEGEPKYLSVYDLESVDVAKSEEYLLIKNNRTPWGERMHPHISNFTRFLGEQIYPKGGELPLNEGQALLLVMMNVAPEAEDEFNKWYLEHITALLAVPGFSSGRRFVAVEGDFKYLAIYDLADPTVLQGEMYEKARRETWGSHIRPFITSRIRNVYRALGGYVLLPAKSSTTGKNAVGGKSRLWRGK